MVTQILVLDGYSPSVAVSRAPLLKVLVERGHKVSVCSPDAEPWVLDALQNLGVSYEPISYDRHSMNPFIDYRIYRDFKQVIERVRPQVVLNYTIKPVIWGSLAANSAGCTAYSLITGIGQLFMDNTIKARAIQLLVSKLYGASLRKNRTVLFQNVDDLAEFRRRGILGPKRRTLVVNGSGVDLARFSPAPLPKTITFLMACRLVPSKGIREFVQAAAEVKSKYPDVRFQLLGPPEPGPNAMPMDEIEGWADERIIEYLGETNDVRPYLRDSSVFVLPSYYREGIPRSILEAMAVGRPIVTTDMPGCRETVKDGENGYLIAPKSVGAITGAIERFLANPADIPRMGARSREMAEERFSQTEVNRVIVEELGL